MIEFKRVEYYTGETEAEVENFLKELKHDHTFEITKSTITKKEKKKTGDEWYRLEVTKVFCDERGDVEE